MREIQTIHALPGAASSHAVERLGRRPEPFDGDELLDGVGVGAGVVQADGSSQRMSDDSYRVGIEGAEKLHDVEYEVGLCIHSADRPGAVAVAA